MTYQYPPPKNWQDFELLCLHLWRSIWADPNAQAHGRRGQPQQGVDIYGQPRLGRRWAGIQCKGKDNFSDQKLTHGEIDKEIFAANEFSPKISSFIIATTGPRDRKVQQYIRAINDSHKIPFKVSFWSWDDIQEELNSRRDVVERVYANLIDVMNVRTPQKNRKGLKFYINKSTPIDKVEAILSRKEFRDNLSEMLRIDIRNVLIELSLNAFEHGHANEIKIHFGEKDILIDDNGNFFNPLIDKSGRSAFGGGLFFFKKFRSRYQKALKVYYTRRKSKNSVRLKFKKPLTEQQIAHSCQIITEKLDAYTRKEASYLGRNAEIPQGCPILYFHVSSRVFTVSSLKPFLTELLNRIPNRSKLCLSFDHRDLLKDMVEKWIEDKYLPNPDIVILK